MTVQEKKSEKQFDSICELMKAVSKHANELTDTEIEEVFLDVTDINVTLKNFTGHDRCITMRTTYSVTIS